MRICLCDDDSTQLELLIFLIHTWQQNSCERCDIVSYHSAEEMLFENMESFPFDLIMLDIQMDKMNGIDLAKKIRENDSNVPIVFLSALSDYVFDGYEVKAIRYLLKPLKEDKLFEILDTMKADLHTEKKYLIISADKEKIKLGYDDIRYIEAFSHYITIHTVIGNYETKQGINCLSNELLPYGFAFTHRSYLVNMKYVEKITKTECNLADGSKLPISKSNYKSVNDSFIQYYKGGVFT